MPSFRSGANDPYLAFSNNLVNQFARTQQFNAQLRFQRERQDRADKRFELQLAQNLDINRTRLGISREHLLLSQQRLESDKMHREATRNISQGRLDLSRKKFEADVISEAEAGRFTAFKSLASIRGTVAGDPALADEARNVIFSDRSISGLLTPPQDPLANLPQDSDLTGTAAFLQENNPVLFESFLNKFAGIKPDETTKFSVQWFEEELGYSPATAQILQDRQFGAAPKLRSPSEQVRDARMIMENALSDQEFQLGEDMLREATEQLRLQREGDKSLFESPPKNKAAFDKKLNELGDTPEADEYFNKHKHLFKIK